MLKECQFLFSGSEPIIFEGLTDGTVVPARGPKVFGWDAIFEPNGIGLTFVTLLCVYSDTHD